MFEVGAEYLTLFLSNMAAVDSVPRPQRSTVVIGVAVGWETIKAGQVGPWSLILLKWSDRLD